MGIDRFEDGGEDPSQKADTGPRHDTVRSGDTGPPGEVPQSGDARRPGDPTPDHPPRESPETTDTETKRAEPRTRNEYADHVAPPGRPPIEDDPPNRETDEQEFGEAMPSGHRDTEKSHSVEEADEQHTETHWDEGDLHTGNDSSALGEEQHSLGHQAIDPDRPENESTEPNHDPEKTRDAAETGSGLGLGRETTAERDDTREPSAVDEPDGPPPDVPLTQETDLDENLSPELPASPEPNDESPTEGHPTDTDPGTEIDEGTHPLTDREWAEHLTEVRQSLDQAREEGLESHLVYTIDPDRQSWSKERRDLHDSIINDLYSSAKDVPNMGCALVAGGLGGAGKTTVLTEHTDIDLSRYLVINPDDLKVEMAKRGMTPEIEGLSPMEASDLVHEESSYLARQLALRAYSDQKNVIWDITMSDEKKTAMRLIEMRNAGYSRVDGLFVDIPVETSIRRTESRHREGHDKYLAGQGLGGRYVPPNVIRDQQDPEWGSQNKRTFHNIRSRFDNWSIYDNSVDWRPARIIESSR